MRISILVALVMSVAAGARAQNREPRLFVDGAVLGDRRPAMEARAVDDLWRWRRAWLPNVKPFQRSF
jgi:hypothetical protein